ncbi:MAG: DNA polymerase III subunit delta' C-terminal domain-containing protein, partial [Sciscionella sp.]
GHIGRARRLARDPQARERRAAVLAIPTALRRADDVFRCADVLVKTAETEASTVSGARDDSEKDALRTAMGADGTGKGAAAANRAANAAVRALEKRQKSRATRTARDSLDLALVDLAGFYRDVLATQCGANATLTHPDRAGDITQIARECSPERALRRLEAVLGCRAAIEANVKPRIAVEALLSTLHHG